MSESGETQAAFDNLAEYYGGMLKMGATTCWESFDVTWLENVCKITELPKEGEADVHGDRGADCYLGFRHSLCHGWSCGFLPFFVEKIVGFRYTDEACDKIVFEPALCGLRYVKAKIPTAKGMIEVEHRQTERGSRDKLSAARRDRIRPCAGCKEHRLCAGERRVCGLLKKRNGKQAGRMRPVQRKNKTNADRRKL